MPYWPPPPKSGCRLRVAPMLAISADELLRTGRLSTVLFHALVAGKTRQPAIIGEVPSSPLPGVPGGTMQPLISTPAATNDASGIPPMRMCTTSASCRPGLEPVAVLGSQRAARVHPESEERNPPHRTSSAPCLRA